MWLFESSVPLPSMKFSRFGSISRSDGTFGLSRKKCTLSNVIWTTCLTPLPRWQVLSDVAWNVVRAVLAVVAAEPGRGRRRQDEAAQE